MPVSIKNNQSLDGLITEPFSSEQELQEALEQCPSLLVDENDPEVFCIKREVHLPSAGKMDMLLFDTEGTPIAVEVKLSRNSESRREVVAQAFDYVSDMSLRTYDELDDLVHGQLSRTLRDSLPDLDYDEIRKTCGKNLRSGSIGVIIAVDEAKPELQRIVRYVNDQSNLDLRLVEISKYNDGDLFVSRLLVSGNKETTKQRSIAARPKVDDHFSNLVNEYNSSHQAPYEARGNGVTYRAIRNPKWPSSVHYEFNNYANEVGVELHLESNDVTYLAELLKSYKGQTIAGKPIEWDGKWSRKRGRISVKFSKDEPNEQVILAMNELIQLTSDSIDAELQKSKNGKQD
jgi:hypothetical protein